MKFTVKALISLIAAAAALTSCKQDDTLQYNNLTMGNVVNGTFTSDQGNIFNVVEKNCHGTLESMDRAIVLCDILRKVEGTDNVYDIRLNDLATVLTKTPISKVVADSGQETLVQDPIAIDTYWISGGYLNLYLVYEVFNYGSLQKHLVNLVLDEKESSAGKYVFELRHNSHGESLVHGQSNLMLGGSYASFPITGLIKEDSAEIIIKWQWYKNVGGGLSSDVQENSLNISYVKGGYEHVPSTYSTYASRTSDRLN